MIVDTSQTPDELARKAARLGAARMRAAIAAQDAAHIILATGASQFAVLACLVDEPDILWPKVTAFHLDEYLDLPATHDASFRRYLKSRFVDKIKDLGEFVFIEGDADKTGREIARVSARISAQDIDVAFIGIGENGHLAFNDPPADFDTTDPYIVVELDHQCRLQQFNEGWFPELAQVPSRAISMSIAQILKSKTIVCSVPDARKAAAVKHALQGPVTNLCPASILQTHAAAHVLLDALSAAQLRPDAAVAHS